MLPVTGVYIPSPGSKDLLPVIDAPVSCGYEVNTMKNTLTIPFTGCLVTHLATCNVSIRL